MMKLVYADIKPAEGLHVAGICSIYVTPKQWLDGDPVIDFETGRILNAVALKENKFWIKVDLLEPSYDFQETPKSSNSGDYKETTLAGTLNYYSFDMLQLLETLRRCQLVVMLSDRNQRRRLVGDSSTGMLFSYSHKIKNGTDRQDIIEVSMIMESEDPAPFYNPDNTPEFTYNLLENIDGNFLLVE